MTANTNATPAPPGFSERGRNSGGQAPAGRGSVPVPEGPGSDWSPTLLLAASAGASLMSTFMELAERVHLPVLGLVTRQRVELDAHHAVTGIVITVCVTVPDQGAATDAGVVWRRAWREATVLKALACPVVAEPSIVVAGDAASGCARAVA